MPPPPPMELWWVLAHPPCHRSFWGLGKPSRALGGLGLSSGGGGAYAPLHRMLLYPPPVAGASQG